MLKLETVLTPPAFAPCAYRVRAVSSRSQGLLASGITFFLERNAQN